MTSLRQASHQTQKPCSKKPRTVPRMKTTQPERLRAAAREAQLARSRAERASALAQRRGQAAASPPSPARRGKAVCAPAAAHRQRAHAEGPPAQATCMQHSHEALQHCSRRPRIAPGKETSASVRLPAAAREAHLMQSRAGRIDALSLMRGQTTGSTPSAAQDGPASGPHTLTSQRAQQHTSMQVLWCSQPAMTSVTAHSLSLSEASSSRADLAPVMTQLPQHLHPRHDKDMHT